jgi:hypothetical protein
MWELLLGFAFMNGELLAWIRYQNAGIYIYIYITVTGNFDCQFQFLSYEFSTSIHRSWYIQFQICEILEQNEEFCVKVLCLFKKRPSIRISTCGWIVSTVATLFKNWLDLSLRTEMAGPIWNKFVKIILDALLFYILRHGFEAAPRVRECAEISWEKIRALIQE